MERDSAVFYRSFYEASKDLPGEVQTDIYRAMFEYAFYKNEIDLEGTAKAIFTLIKPQLDANIRKYENGKNGGRPSKNENQEETKPKAKNNQEETKPKGNENVSASANASLNYNSNADVDEDAEKVTIAACEDLFLKNEEVYKATAQTHNIKNMTELKVWVDKFRLKLIKDEVKLKTPKDYNSHLDRWIGCEIKKSKNSSNKNYGPHPDSYESGKLPRVPYNTSDGIPTFTMDEFIRVLQKPAYNEYVEKLYEEYGVKPKNLGYVAEKFKNYVETQGPGNEPKNMRDATKYFNNWVRLEIKDGNLNSYLKHPKKQIGAL